MQNMQNENTSETHNKRGDLTMYNINNSFTYSDLFPAKAAKKVFDAGDFTNDEFSFAFFSGKWSYRQNGINRWFEL
jgi:hypothetical protein